MAEGHLVEEERGVQQGAVGQLVAEVERVLEGEVQEAADHQLVLGVGVQQGGRLGVGRPYWGTTVHCLCVGLLAVVVEACQSVGEEVHPSVEQEGHPPGVEGACQSEVVVADRLEEGGLLPGEVPVGAQEEDLMGVVLVGDEDWLVLPQTPSPFRCSASSA